MTAVAVRRPRQVDVRGPRFTAWVTATVLVVALVTQVWEIAAAQTVVFGVGAFAGLRYAPYPLVFRYAVKPLLGPTTETEDEAPPRFAQAVGFVFAAVATIGFSVGPTALGTVAAALALAAAVLNAAFGICLGCLLYLRYRRLVGVFAQPASPAGQ
jgi:hypothetical protein